MKTPLCFCNGVIRSGSTWSFNVCRGLFKELSIQLRQPYGSTYLDGEFVEQFVAQHWEKCPGPTVIKAHAIGRLALTAIRSGQAKAVCTYRDPRDCVASDVVFMNRGFEYSVKRVAGSLEFLNYYQSTPHILLVQYEEMMRDRVGQIRRIAAHLGMRGNEEMIARVDAGTSLEESQKVCRDLKNRPSDSVLNIQSHRVDPDTHLHENHIGNAKIGRWKEELSTDQARWLTEYFSPWLLQLGYETPESLKTMVSRPVPVAPAAYAPAAHGPNVSRMGSFSIGAGLSR